MRRFVAFAMAAVMGFAVVDPAFAKKPKPESTDAAAPAELVIEPLNIPDIDNVFTKANAPIQTIKDSRAKIDGINAMLAEALGLASGSGVEQIAADLQAKGPSGVGDDVKAKIAQAKSDLAGIVTNLQGLPAQFQEIAGAAAGINPVEAAKAAGAAPADLLKIPKKFSNNVKVLGSAPSEVEKLLASVNALTGTLTSIVP